MNSDDEFRKWQYGFRIKIQNMQGWYPQKPDAVKSELERLDRLEQVVAIRDTKWVEEYCAKLQSK